MRHVLTLASIVFLIGCDAGFAQVAPTTGMGMGGIGATSPRSDMSVGPTGIPMGATELNTVGVSPLFSTLPCPPPTSTTTGMAAAASTFDGGGMPSSAMANTSCGGGTGSAATASPSDMTGLASGSNAVGIGLGATEVNTPGESAALPLAMVPSLSPVPGAVPPQMSGTASASLPSMPAISSMVTTTSPAIGMAAMSPPRRIVAPGRR